MADSGPEDHNRTALYSEDASLMQTPTFVPAQSPAFRWGEVEGEDFTHTIQSCYEGMDSSLETKLV